MFDCWLWSWVRVRGWVCTASHMYVQRWLRIHVDHDNRVCGKHEHVRRVWRRLQLRRQRRPSSCVLVFCRLRVDVHYIKCMRHKLVHVLAVWMWRRQCVRRRGVAAGHVHMQRWLPIHIDSHNRVYGNHGRLRCVWCWLKLRGE